MLSHFRRFTLLLLLPVVLGMALEGAFLHLRGLSLATVFGSPPTLEAQGPTIVQQIQSLARLETVVYTEQQLLEGHKDWGGMPAWLLGDRLSFIAHGEVVAGIDLSGFGSRSLRITQNQVLVSLPQPIVFHVRLDNQTSQVCSRTTGLFNRPDPQLETEVRQQAERTLLASALRDRILQQARQNAVQQIDRLVRGLGAQHVQIRFV